MTILITAAAKIISIMCNTFTVARYKTFWIEQHFILW
jgi:hypothetical protein